MFCHSYTLFRVMYALFYVMDDSRNVPKELRNTVINYAKLIRKIYGGFWSIDIFGYFR